MKLGAARILGAALAVASGLQAQVPPDPLGFHFAPDGRPPLEVPEGAGSVRYVRMLVSGPDWPLDAGTIPLEAATSIVDFRWAGEVRRVHRLDPASGSSTESRWEGGLLHSALLVGFPVGAPDHVGEEVFMAFEGGDRTFP